MRRTLPFLLALSLSLLLLAAPASASLTDRLLADFSKTGQLNACNYSENELSHIKSLIIPNDIDAYQPDFRTALDAMIAKRAQGACAKKQSSGGAGGGSAAGAGGSGAGGGSSGASPGAGTGGGAAAGTTGGAGSVPSPDQMPAPAPLIATDSIADAARSHHGGATPPVPLLAIAVLVALLALGGLAYWVARWTGWEPSWTGRARHATSEAGARASSTWADFTDFVRLGR